MATETTYTLASPAVIMGFVMLAVLVAGAIYNFRLYARHGHQPASFYRPAWLDRNPFWLIDIVRLLTLVVGLGCLVMLVSKLLGPADTESVANPVLLAIEAGGLPLIVVGYIAAVLRKRGISWRDAFMPVDQPAASIMTNGLKGYVALMPPTAAAALLFGSILQALGIEPSAQPVIELLSDADVPLASRVSLAMMALVLAPLVEELVFRGMALPALMKQTSPVFAMLAVSTLFAVVHFHLPAVLPLFIIAMACSIAYVRTGSILVPIIMHATFNATTLLSLLAQGNS